MQPSLGAGIAAACLGLGAATAQPLDPLATDDLAARACQALNAIDLPELVAVDARWQPPNAAGPDPAAAPGDEASALPAHCRVSGRVAAAIGFELWLPDGRAWNGRFLAAGNTGTGGSFEYSALRGNLAQGYATAATDTGHDGAGLGWLGDDASLRDFAYRAVYEMTVKANALILAFYGRPADYKYFNGCSLGGRQGLVEAARFPSDYDGIVAGAPQHALVAAASSQLWLAQTVAAPGGGSSLSAAALALVTDAAIEQCDAIDGIRDGLLEDPRRCNFDPGRLQCGLGAQASCLTPSQLSVLRSIYAGPPAGSAGARLPGLAIGGEAGWEIAISAQPPAFAVELFRRAVFDDLAWDWRSFELASDHALALERVGWMFDEALRDFSSFQDNGGKLLIYQGWNDAIVAPEATIARFEAIEAQLARQTGPAAIAAGDTVRLFLVPGMRHCGGGGTDSFDAQRAIEDWVERGIAPERIEAARIENDTVIRTRPLCPYPQIARYRGSGNSDLTGSFVCDF